MNKREVFGLIWSALGVVVLPVIGIVGGLGVFFLCFIVFVVISLRFDEVKYFLNILCKRRRG